VGSPTSGSLSNGTDAVSGTQLRPVSRSLFPVEVLRCWWWRLKQRVLRPDPHNRACRIGRVPEICRWEPQGYLDPRPLVFAWSPNPRDRTAKRAYTSHTQPIAAHRSFPIVDFSPSETGWTDGQECGFCNCILRNLQSTENPSAWTSCHLCPWSLFRTEYRPSSPDSRRLHLTPAFPQTFSHLRRRTAPSPHTRWGNGNERCGN
jgi:hypothetical protein